MTSGDWIRVKELFEAALDLEPPEREAYLIQNCGDHQTREHVRRLVRNYVEAGDFLDEPAFSRLWEAHSSEDFLDSDTGAAVVVTDTSADIKDPMAGHRCGAYRLVTRIAQGGMAAVFLAVRADDEYQKEVAIKLVQPGPDSHELLYRFQKERQTLAGLDHPNVVKLLDGGSTPEGWPFLVMDYVEGSPIDEYCDEHKLSIDKRLHLFWKVCAAVQYAHEKLVIHRDLKPSNILVTADGTPKLLDFGIAKVLNSQPFAQRLLVSQTGTRCMTPAYASPEQMRGKSITTASDIYSLGVLLYELLSGHRPYRLKQDTPAEMERAICEQDPDAPSTAVSRAETDTPSGGIPITKTPEGVSETREGQPEKLRRRLRGDLDNIVLKALQKQPERRYGSVEEFAQDIERHLQHLPVKARRSTLTYWASKFARRHKVEVSSGLVVIVTLTAGTFLAVSSMGTRGSASVKSAQIQSLAVLPLANLSGDPAQEYFSDGMTDALIADLAQIGSLKVISRTSSEQYKQTRKSLPEIGRELNVDGIIEGTVQRSGDRVRITAQLIQVPADKHLWASSYERDVGDVFMLERGVAGDIARQVQARLATDKHAQRAQPRPINPRALEAYLQGNSHMHKFSRGFGDEELRLANQYFQQAIDAEPDFAPAYVGVSNARRVTLRSSNEDKEIAAKAAERAVELDPNLSDAWVALANLWCDSWDWARAEQDYRRALALNPNDANAHEGLSFLLDAFGRLDEGWKEAEIAQQLDPNEDQLEPALGNRHEYDKIIQHITRMLDTDPDNGVLHYMLVEGYIGKRMYKEAVEQLEQTLVLFGFQESAAKVRQAFAASGYKGAMREYAKELEYLHATNQLFIPINLAEAYTAAGDKDRAFYWLEQAYKRRGQIGGLSMVFVNRDSLLEPLHSDQRYKDLLQRVGLPR
jgi:serine/threonine protein kinase/tetratricopeptide (TPR) repeat protein